MSHVVKPLLLLLVLLSCSQTAAALFSSS